MFFHKLAIHPTHLGKGFGQKALELIRQHAKKLNIEWLRLDCDDRPALHQFYSAYGFSLVDTKPMTRYMKQYMVSRYQLLTSPHP